MNTLITRRLPLALHQHLVHSLQPAAIIGSRGLATTSKLCGLAIPTGTSPPASEQHVLQSHPADAPRAISASSPANAAGGLKAGSFSHPEHDWVMHHPVYSPEELNSVVVVRQARTTVSDHIASSLVAFARWGFDVITRYKHASPEAALAAATRDGKTNLSIEELRAQGYVMTVEQWLMRIVFLESIAGVPGMVAAMVRHLRSLRLMKRDGGFIKTLLEEAENERMHLMTFLKIKNPSPFFRLIVLATQGVFFNAFFFSYLISPRACHRFVAYLEEEACVTYTNIVEEMKRNNIPEWAPGAQAVPQIAKDYWRLDDSATMLDLILAVRADEASHRFVNHTIANLGDADFNPFGLKQAGAVTQGTVAGFTREESLAWCKKVEEAFKEEKKAEKIGLAEKKKSGSSL